MEYSIRLSIDGEETLSKLVEATNSYYGITFTRFSAFNVQKIKLEVISEDFAVVFLLEGSSSSESVQDLVDQYSIDEQTVEEGLSNFGVGSWFIVTPYIEVFPIKTIRV